MARTERVGETVETVDVASLLKQMSTVQEQMATVLRAIADGQASVDGGSVHVTPAPRAVAPRTSYRPTIREQRVAQTVLADNTPQPHAQTIMQALDSRHQGHASKGKSLPARVVYDLAPIKGRPNVEGLSPAGVSILKYLASHHQTSIGALMRDLKLARSTIANVLTVLRTRKLVVSKEVQ